MSVNYQQLLHDVALRLSALTGTNALGTNTSYDTSVLTSAQFKSVDWPFNSFKDAILMAEETFADVAASSVDQFGEGSHPWRATIGGTISAQANGAIIPPTDSGSNRVIGAYGEVVDALDGTSKLVRRPLEFVQRTKAESWRLYPVYYYCISGRHVFHTRTTVTIGCCVYNRVTQAAAFIANSAMLLPDTAEPGIMALAISLMTRDGAFSELAERYHTAAAEALALVAKGGVPDVKVAA